MKKMIKCFVINYSESFICCFVMLLMMLFGIFILYYGDEINMVDFSILFSSSILWN